MDNQMMGGKPVGAMKCGCSHHMWFGIVVIVFGALFLLESFGVLGASVVDVVWPILVVAGGALMLMDRKCTCCAG